MTKTKNGLNECSECKSTFIRQADIIRHIKRFHSSKADKLISGLGSKVHPFKCDQCDKKFFHKKNLNFHKKSHNNTSNNTGVIIKKKCPLCDHVATFKKDFYDHCRETHSILLDVEKMDFPSINDFVSWKTEVEKALDSKFVKEYGSTPRMTNYICDHSEYSSLENGTTQLSDNKVNGFCPAGFRVMHEEDGKCSIYFVKTHICHKNKSLIFPNNTESGQSNESDQVGETEVTKKPEPEIKVIDGDNTKKESPKNRKSAKKIVQEELKPITKKNNFPSMKKKLIKNVLTTLNSISSLQELDAAQELLHPLQPVLTILRKNFEPLKRKK